MIRRSQILVPAFRARCSWKRESISSGTLAVLLQSVCKLSARGCSTFNQDNQTDDDKFASLQSMLLYQLLGLFHRDEQRE